MFYQSKDKDQLSRSRQAKCETSEQAVVELSDEQLELISGGGDWTNNKYVSARFASDFCTLGTAEIGWHTKKGKEVWNSGKDYYDAYGEHRGK